MRTFLFYITNRNTARWFVSVFVFAKKESYTCALDDRVALRLHFWRHIYESNMIYSEHPSNNPPWREKTHFMAKNIWLKFPIFHLMRLSTPKQLVSKLAEQSAG